MPTMELKKEGAVYILSLTNGAKANTITDDVIGEYNSVLDELEAAPGNAALVITSTDPKYWSNGIDREWLMTKPPNYLIQVASSLDQTLSAPGFIEHADSRLFDRSYLRRRRHTCRHFGFPPDARRSWIFLFSGSRYSYSLHTDYPSYCKELLPDRHARYGTCFNRKESRRGRSIKDENCFRNLPGRYSLP